MRPNDSIALGRVGSTRIAASWTLLPILALVTWSLADGLLPFEAPLHSPAAYWVAGAVTAVAFFAGLLAHELAHTAVAVRRGLEVPRITLWLFGGVAEMSGDTRSPGEEFAVAVAGPAASLAIAGVAAAASWLAGQWGASDLVTSSLTWMSRVNALLGVFNLLPAFPLDGGRVFRSLLWRVWHDRIRATTAAARTGQVLGAGLIVVGILAWMRGGGAFGGLWFALIGWFVVSAAGSQLRSVTVDAALNRLRAADVMTPRPDVVRADAALSEVVDRNLRPSGPSSFPVVDATDTIVGLLTADAVRAVPRADWLFVTARSVAVPNSDLAVCRPDDTLDTVVGRLRRSPGGRVLVIDGGRLVGIIAPADVSAALGRPWLAARPKVPA